MASATRVRPALITDLPALIAIHHEAFPDSLATALGQGYLRTYYQWFIESPNAIAFIAEQQGSKPIGFVVGTDNARRYYDDLYGARRRTMLRSMVIGLVTHPLAFVRLSRALGLVKDLIRRRFARRKSPPPPQVAAPEATPPISNATLISIAIHPAAQGSGASTPLMNSFVDECRQRSCDRITLSVRRTNLRAIRFYEREGWQHTRDTEDMAHYSFMLD